MGSKKSKSTTNSSSQSSSDYIDWTKGSGQNALNDLNDLYNKDKNKSPEDQVYQGDRVINDYNEDTKQGISNQQKNAANAEHTTTDIHDMVQGGVNPYFEQNLQNNLNKIRDMTNNNASAAGYGGSDIAKITARELGQAGTSALADQWNQTENRRLQANQLEQQAYRNQAGNINDAINAAGKNDVLNQAKLDANREKWQEQQDYGWNNLGKYIEGINSIRSGTGYGTSSGTSTTTNKTSSSPLEIAGGIANLGSSLFAPKGAGLFSGLFK